MGLVLVPSVFPRRLSSLSASFCSFLILSAFLLTHVSETKSTNGPGPGDEFLDTTPTLDLDSPDEKLSVPCPFPPMPPNMTESLFNRSCLFKKLPKTNKTAPFDHARLYICNRTRSLIHKICLVKNQEIIAEKNITFPESGEDTLLTDFCGNLKLSDLVAQSETKNGHGIEFYKSFIENGTWNSCIVLCRGIENLDMVNGICKLFLQSSQLLNRIGGLSEDSSTNPDVETSKTNTEDAAGESQVEPASLTDENGVDKGKETDSSTSSRSRKESGKKLKELPTSEKSVDETDGMQSDQAVPEVPSQNTKGSPKDDPANNAEIHVADDLSQAQVLEPPKMVSKKEDSGVNTNRVNVKEGTKDVPSKPKDREGVNGWKDKDDENVKGGLGKVPSPKFPVSNSKPLKKIPQVKSNEGPRSPIQTTLKPKNVDIPKEDGVKAEDTGVIDGSEAKETGVDDADKNGEVPETQARGNKNKPEGTLDNNTDGLEEAKTKDQETEKEQTKNEETEKEKTKNEEKEKEKTKDKETGKEKTKNEETEKEKTKNEETEKEKTKNEVSEKETKAKEGNENKDPSNPNMDEPQDSYEGPAGADTNGIPGDSKVATYDDHIPMPNENLETEKENRIRLPYRKPNSNPSPVFNGEGVPETSGYFNYFVVFLGVIGVGFLLFLNKKRVRDKSIPYYYYHYYFYLFRCYYRLILYTERVKYSENEI